MPTGYTAGVQDGSVTSFREYALQCARAFGACVMLRDEPLSSDIPEFEPSTFSRDGLAKAMQELAQWNEMTDYQRREMQEQEYADECTYKREARKRRDEQRARYEAMLDIAKRFQAPTKEHEEYAKFLVSQLEQSLEWDCECDYYDEKPMKPFDEWKDDKLSKLCHLIEYHSKHWAEEQHRTDERNRWVRQLRVAIDLCEQQLNAVGGY